MTLLSRRIMQAFLSAAVSLSGFAAPAAGDDAEAEIKALREQIQTLDRRLQELEQKQKHKEEEAAAAAAKTLPKIDLTENGFRFASGDGASWLRLGSLIQLDSRLFFHDGGMTNNAFVLRRGRLIAEGALGPIYSFQMVTEFGGSAVSVLDANLTIAPSNLLQFKIGRFKAPVGLELLQSDSATFFAERSLVTNLVPNRDLGVQAGGSLRNGAFTYTIGLFNGVADAASTTNADYDNDKDVVGRVFVQPFKNGPESPWRGLGLGLAASSGRQKGTSAVTAGYKTDGQQTFFKYGGTVLADGQVWRVSPQAFFSDGPFSVLGEYAVSGISVRPAPGAAATPLEHHAWQMAAGWVLTGEDASFTGLQPSQPFNWAKRNWGAWQVVVRYADLKLDDRTFPLFAAPATSAGGASSVGLGVNWYLSRIMRTSLDLFQTRFRNAGPGPVTNPVIRQEETALISRFQLSF